jgi:hypothetical protein
MMFTQCAALFLSDRAPLRFPGFSILCASIALLLAFIISCFIGPLPIHVPGENRNEYVTLPTDEVQDDTMNTATE